MTRVRIVDLDSTISDDLWRQWMIDPSQPDGDAKYHTYHLHCDRDRVMNRHIVDDSPVAVIFLTARPEYLRQKTQEWLSDHGFEYVALVMRANNDHTPSPEMKKNALAQIRRLFEVERAYDDRKDVVQMFRENGVEAILV